jgi:predicted permease
VVDRLSGHAGIASFAVLIGVMVPWVNAVSVWFLARQGGASVWRELAKNPLIVATLSGFIVSLFGLPLPGEVNHVLDLLAAAALPLGLLSVGAGLRAEGLRASLPLVNYFTFVKLVAVPAAAWGLALLLGLGRSSRHRHGADPAVSSDYHLPQRATACPIPLIFFHGKHKKKFQIALIFFIIIIHLSNTDLINKHLSKII